MKFKEYNTDENGDGSVNIRALEIFRLCKREDKEYNESWFKKALKYFEAEKMDEYMPPAFIGHEEIPGKETEAIGFLDNLKLIGETVYADILKVPAEIFKKLKERSFPNRSVELHPKTGQIMGLAFLGKTRPYHKLPLMEFRDEEIDVEHIDFEGDDLFADVADGAKKDHLKKAMAGLIEAIKSTVEKFKENDEMTPEELTKMKEDLKTELQADFDAKFEEKYKTRFKEEFGADPETFKNDQEKLLIEKFKEKKDSIIKKLKGLKLAPAVVDGFMAPLIEAFSGLESEPITFAEKEEGNIFDVMEKFGESLVKRAENGTLLVDFDEHAGNGTDEGNPNFKQSEIDVTDMTKEEAAALDKKIREFQEKNKIETYEEAVEKYYEQMK